VPGLRTPGKEVDNVRTELLIMLDLLPLFSISVSSSLNPFDSCCLYSVFGPSRAAVLDTYNPIAKFKIIYIPHRLPLFNNDSQTSMTQPILL